MQPAVCTEVPTHPTPAPSWPGENLKLLLGNTAFPSLCPASRGPCELLAWPGPRPGGRGSAIWGSWAGDTLDHGMGEKGTSEVSVSQNLPEEKK